MKKLEPKLLPMHIGSMPHADPAVACDLTFQHFPRLPTWPQLPRRSPLENMYTQFSERFPGIVVEPENNRLYVNREADLDPELEQLYLAYLENDIAFGALSPDYAAGLYTFMKRAPEEAGEFLAIKGQVTGPVSWGLRVSDQNRRPILYDEILADAVAKFLRLKATWQEKKLQEIFPTTIISVDEPYMANFGSALIPIQRDQVITLVEEVLSGIEGIKGSHCCGNTDWSILLETSIDIISFDAYGYGHTLPSTPTQCAPSWIEAASSLGASRPTMTTSSTKLPKACSATWNAPGAIWNAKASPESKSSLPHSSRQPAAPAP